MPKWIKVINPIGLSHTWMPWSITKKIKITFLIKIKLDKNRLKQGWLQQVSCKNLMARKLNKIATGF